MTDIREILNALDENDRKLWQQHRTEMRRSYLNAHNATLGTTAWDANDDAFLDFIDIKLAYLFDRSGRFAATKDIIGQDDKIIEENILKDDDNLSIKSSATKMMQNGWGK